MTLRKFTVLALGAFLALPLAAPTAEADVFEGSGPINISIPDNDPLGITNTITIGVDETIKDVNVGFIMEHTWQGDIIATLTHVNSNTSVDLIFRPGDSGGLGAGFSADNFGTAGGGLFLLDDEADAAYDSDVGWGATADPGIPDVGGSWVPYGAFPGGTLGGLSAFDGLSTASDWTLFVSDNAVGDLGTLNAWGIFITSNAAAIPEPSSALALLGLSGLALVRRRK